VVGLAAAWCGTGLGRRLPAREVGP